MHLSNKLKNLPQKSLTRTGQILAPLLSGIFAFYKPPEISEQQLEQKICRTLARDLTILFNHEPGQLIHSSELAKPECFEFRQRFFSELLSTIPFDELETIYPFKIRSADLKCKILNAPAYNHTGVTLIALYEGLDALESIENAHWLCEYELKGKLGQASANFRQRNDRMITGNFSSQHVTDEQLMRAVSVLDARFRYQIVESVAMNTSASQAFKLLKNGPPRQTGIEGSINSDHSKIYSIELQQFQPPEFVLKMHGIDTSENDLNSIIPYIGKKVNSMAVSKTVRRARFGPVKAQHCLAHTQLRIDHIMHNMIGTTELVSQKSLFGTDHIQAIDSLKSIEGTSGAVLAV